MAEGGGSSGTNRRQLLGILGAGTLTALSAAVVATSTAFDDDEPEDDAEDGTDASPPGDDGDENEDDSPALLSVDWDASYGDGAAGSFTAANWTDSGPEFAGVRLDEDDAGVGWLVEGADPDSETVDRTYISESNRSNRERDRGYGVHDAIELVLPVDDGRLLVGWTHDISPDSKTPWIRRVDGDGEVVWDAEYPRPAVDSFRELFLDGVVTDDGGAMLAGVTLGSEFVDMLRGDGWLVKITADGELEWEQTYNTVEETHTNWIEDDRHDRFTTISPIEDGYLLAGTTTLGENSSVAPSEPWVVAVDEEGERRWEAFEDRQAVEATNKRDRVIQDVVSTEDGVLVAGTIGTHEYDRLFRRNVLRGEGWLGYVEDGSFEWQRRTGDMSIRTIDHVGNGYYVLTGRREDSAWVGLADTDDGIVDEIRLHEVDGEVLATVHDGGELVVAGHRDDADAPVAFAAGVSVELPDS